jgi:hypothetical protein
MRPAAVPAPSATEPDLVHLGRLPGLIRRGLLLLLEVVVVPGAVLYSLVAAGHPVAGILAVLGWRAGCIGARLVAGVRVPATCWLAFGLFLARTVAGVAFSSVSLYLLVPVVLCAAQGLFFVGSALTRRPLMMRLVADFAAGLPDRPELRRVFAQTCVIWGAAHLVSAAVGAWALTLPNAEAVAVTSSLGFVCAVSSVAGCLAWGLWRAARIPGLGIVCADRPLSLSVPARVPVPATA